jgi:ABC-2 type transport system permease protein
VTGLVRSELRKLVSTRSWWGLLLGVLLSSAALAGVIGGFSGRTAVNGRYTAGVDDPAVVRSIYTAGLTVATLFALALGVIAMAGEYRHHTITSTVLATPRRIRVVLAKAVAVLGVGLGYGLAAVAGGLLVGIPTVRLRGGAPLLTGDGVPRALALAVLAVALWTLIGLGMGTLIHNQIVALLVCVGTAWIAEPVVALVLNAVDVGAVAQFLPSQATSALVQPSTGANPVGTQLLPWWGGALVLVGYALLSGALGAVLTLRRDIT